MKCRLLALFAVASLFSVGVMAQRVQTPELDRGLVAVKTTSGVFCSWRIPGEEYYDVKYNIYRDGTLLNSTPLSVSNYEDASGTVSNTYTVSAVVRGVEQTQCAAVSVWSTNYFDIAVDHERTDCSFEPNDATIADVDGDGEMEILIKFRNNTTLASNDAFQSATVFDIIECYKLNGTRLWWIDCGPNMIDFQSNEINIAAYDWDGDGKAECVMRAADNTVFHFPDGTTHTVGDASVDTRSTLDLTSSQYFTFTGGEYFLYFNGETAEIYQEFEYPLKRLETGETSLSDAWGDGYGHRSSKHFFGAPYFDGHKPSIFLARGIYTRHKMIAYDVDPTTHEVSTRWEWKCSSSSSSWYGQGYHNYTIADVDWDGRDEIVFGSMVIDDNGKGLSTTGLGHGDAHHVSDLNPYIHGQEVYACNEDEPCNNYRDATTSKIYYRHIGTNDDGRSMAGNFCNDYVGAMGFSARDGAISCVTNGYIDGLSTTGVTSNFRIYWDGDLQEESFNGKGTSESEGAIYKYGKSGPYHSLTGSLTNNSTKATPCLQADLFGDWREEVIMRTSDGNIRIFTANEPTEWRVYTLLDDHQYRNAMITQMNGYNQPPHTSYFLGELEGITVPPPPTIMRDREEITAGGTLGSAYDDKHVVFSDNADATITVSEGAAPYIFTDNAPSWVQGNDDNDNIVYTYYTHTLTGAAFTGSMRLIKQGDGALVLPEVEQAYTGETNVWAGSLYFDGTMRSSPVWLNRFAELHTSGTFNRAVTMEYDSKLYVGGNGTVGTATVDTLVMNCGAKWCVDMIDDGENVATDLLNIGVLEINTFDSNGMLDYDGPVVSLNITFNGSSTRLTAGSYKIATVGSIVGELENMSIIGKAGQQISFNYEDGALYLVVADLRDATTIYWTGAQSNEWDLATTLNFVDANGDETFFVTGDVVVFDDSATNFDVLLVEDLSAAQIIFANETKEYTVTNNSSYIVEFDESLVKKGEGTLNLDIKTAGPAVSITGGTVVVSDLAYSAGSSNAGLGSESTTIYLAGATLELSGAVYCSQVLTVGEGAVINTPSGASLLLEEQVLADATSTNWTKSGTGSLTLAASKNGGYLHIAAGSVNGSENTYFSKVYFEGGAMYDLDNIYSYSAISTNYVCETGQSGSLYLDARCEYSGSLTGSGTMTVYAQSVRANMNGDWSSFDGTLNIAANKTSSYTPIFYLNNTYGLPNAAIKNSTIIDNNGKSMTLGKVTGDGTLQGSGTYSIGSLNDNFTFSNTLTSCGFIKVGTGVLTMTSTQQGVSSVEVSGGTLNCRTTTMNSTMFGTKTVTVNSGATLSGRANIYKTIVASGGTLAPGDARQSSLVGYITSSEIYVRDGGNISFNLVNNKGSVTSCSYVTATTSLTIKGNIIVNLDDSYTPAIGDAFTLWEATSLTMGDTYTLTLPTLPDGMFWDTSSLFNSTGVLRIADSEDSGMKYIASSEDVVCEVFNLAGVKVAEFATTRAAAEGEARTKVVGRGIFIVIMRSGSLVESTRITVK